MKNAGDATGQQLLSYYQLQLAGTYLAYSGTGTFNTSGDYIRLDGPDVWIEFIVWTGAEIRTQVHYHALYRDRARDYGGNFYGSYTTVLGARAGRAATTVFTAYPNPWSAVRASTWCWPKPASRPLTACVTPWASR